MSAQSQLGFGFDRTERDITARKHGGNRHSQQAHERLKPCKATMRERIRVWVAACEYKGATLKEVCKTFGKLPNEISGRFSALKKDGLIFDSMRERDGCTVWVAKKEWCALWARPEVEL